MKPDIVILPICWNTLSRAKDLAFTDVGTLKIRQRSLGRWQLLGQLSQSLQLFCFPPTSVLSTGRFVFVFVFGFVFVFVFVCLFCCFIHSLYHQPLSGSYLVEPFNSASHYSSSTTILLSSLAFTIVLPLVGSLPKIRHLQKWVYNKTCKQSFARGKW